MIDADIDTKVDLRTARRAGSRRQMLIAGLRLIEKGHYRLSPQEVSDQAGMHRRSLYAIFGDFDTYLEELVATHEASINDVILKRMRDRKSSLASVVVLGH